MMETELTETLKTLAQQMAEKAVSVLEAEQEKLFEQIRAEKAAEARRKELYLETGVPVAIKECIFRVEEAAAKGKRCVSVAHNDARHGHIAKDNSWELGRLVAEKLKSEEYGFDVAYNCGVRSDDYDGCKDTYGYGEWIIKW